MTDLYFVEDTPMRPKRYKVRSRLDQDNSWVNFFETTGEAQREADRRNTPKWCPKCQATPCVGDDCRIRQQKLDRFAFLSGFDMRSDDEESEVYALQANLLADGVATGWPITPRRLP